MKFIKDWRWCILYAIIPFVAIYTDFLKDWYYQYEKTFWIIFSAIVIISCVIINEKRYKEEELKKLVHDGEYIPKKRGLINTIRQDIQEDKEYRENRKSWFNSLSQQEQEKELKRRKLETKGIIIGLSILILLALLIYLPEILG